MSGVSAYLSVEGKGQMLRDVLIPNTRDGGFHPHKVDFYVPAGNPAKGTVLLHGGGGVKALAAQEWRVSYSKTPSYEMTNWRMLNFWNVTVACPQGQACVGNVNEYNPTGIDTRNANSPNGVPTWNNRDMISSADDVQMLRDLVTYMAANFGTSSHSLFGYSEGGMMVKRMWYEAPAVFRQYVSVAGPANRYYLDNPITPAVIRPMLMLNGELDTNLNGEDMVGPHFQDEIWTQDASTISRAMVSFPALSQRRGEWQQFLSMCALNSEAAPAFEAAVVDPMTVGSRRVWKPASEKFELHLYSQVDHGFRRYQDATDKGMFAMAMQFVTSR